MLFTSEYIKTLEERFKKPTTTDSHFQEAINALMSFMGEGRNVRMMYAVATKQQRSGYSEIRGNGIEAQKQWVEMVYATRFKYWCGRTSVLRGNKAQKILELIARCQDAQNPQKAFNVRLKLIRSGSVQSKTTTQPFSTIK